MNQNLDSSSSNVVRQQEAPVEHVKSSFEQRLEAQRAEEHRRLQMQQEALQRQRAREQRPKEEPERQQQHTDTSREQQHRSASSRQQFTVGVPLSKPVLRHSCQEED